MLCRQGGYKNETQERKKGSELLDRSFNLSAKN